MIRNFLNAERSTPLKVGAECPQAKRTNTNSFSQMTYGKFRSAYNVKYITDPEVYKIPIEL